ncbi:MAG: N-acetylmuramidase domain-containing protein [Thermodesulfobacteriota bacterium]
MPDQFRDKALPLNQEGVAEAVDRLQVTVAELWAVLNVETRGCGFLADRRPMILFERHIFSRETDHRFDASHPEISNPKTGGYGAGGAAQYDRLYRALALDRRAALRSTSWGIGQLMGFNAEISGYAGVEEMITAMTISENHQLLGMAGEITSNRLDRALRAHDWAAFARGYNGPEYAKNSYDTRLAAAYQKYTLGPLPDLVVRAGQIYLMYLGYHPGSVDGISGRFTRSALNEFQEQYGLPVTSEIHEDQLEILQGEVEKLPV